MTRQDAEFGLILLTVFWGWIAFYGGWNAGKSLFITLILFLVCNWIFFILRLRFFNQPNPLKSHLFLILELTRAHVALKSTHISSPAAHNQLFNLSENLFLVRFSHPNKPHLSAELFSSQQATPGLSDPPLPPFSKGVTKPLTNAKPSGSKVN